MIGTLLKGAFELALSAVSTRDMVDEFKLNQGATSKPNQHLRVLTCESRDSRPLLPHCLLDHGICKVYPHNFISGFSPKFITFLRSLATCIFCKIIKGMK